MPFLPPVRPASPNSPSFRGVMSTAAGASLRRLACGLLRYSEICKAFPHFRRVERSDAVLLNLKLTETSNATIKKHFSVFLHRHRQRKDDCALGLIRPLLKNFQDVFSFHNLLYLRLIIPLRYLCRRIKGTGTPRHVTDPQ